MGSPSLELISYPSNVPNIVQAAKHFTVTIVGSKFYLNVINPTDTITPVGSYKVRITWGLQDEPDIIATTDCFINITPCEMTSITTSVVTDKTYIIGSGQLPWILNQRKISQTPDCGSLFEHTVDDSLDFVTVSYFW